MSQTAIRRALLDGKKLSQLTVLRDFGCMRLAAVIHRLRKGNAKRGRPPMKIETTYREQNGKKYAVYRLESKFDE